MSKNLSNSFFVFLPPRPWEVKLDQFKSEELTLHDCQNNTFNHLQKLGVKVKILIPTFSQFSFFQKLNPFILGLDFIRAIKVLIFYRKATCIISIFESGGFFILLLRKLFYFKPKIILWDLSAGNQWRLVKIIQKVTLPRYDGFMLLTSSQIDFITKNKFPGKVKLINYNVDEDFFHPQYSEVGEYLLSVGDDNSRDYPALLSAISGLDIPTIIKSTIVAEKNEVPNLIIIKERLTPESYRSLFAKALLIIIPLHQVEHAGGITVLFESMAMGKPVIITESSISNDFLSHESNCLVVPSNNPEALRLAIDRLLNDYDLRQKLGKNLRNILDNSFTTKHLAQNIKTFCFEF